MNAKQTKELKAINDELDKLYDRASSLASELEDDDDEQRAHDDIQTCADHIERAKDEIANLIK